MTSKLSLIVGLLLSLSLWARSSDNDAFRSFSSYEPHLKIILTERFSGIQEVPVIDSLQIDSTAYFEAKAFYLLQQGETAQAAIFLEKHIKGALNPEILSAREVVAYSESAPIKALTKKYMPKLSGWTAFYFYTGFIGLFIAFVLNMRKNTDRIANGLISALVLLHSFFILHISIFLSNYSYQVPHSLYATASFSFLYGPLLYFYMKRVTESYQFKKRDVLHLLPSLVLFLYMMPYYVLPSDEKLWLMFHRDEELHPTTMAIVFLKIISLATYGLLALKTYRSNALLVKDPTNSLVRWQRNIVHLNIVYVASYILYGLIVIQLIKVSWLIHPQIIIMAFLVLYIGYSTFTIPAILNYGADLRTRLAKYQKSGLTDDYSLEIKQTILQLFENEKFYKESSVSLGTLSKRLDTTRHNTSQVINEHFEMNFFELVNKFRIEEAKQLIAENRFGNLTMLEIAFEVGFNNKVTFNKAFKKETSLTPTQYLRTLDESQGGKFRVSPIRQG